MCIVQLTASDVTCLSPILGHLVIRVAAVMCATHRRLCGHPGTAFILPRVAGAAPDSACLGTDVDGTPLLLLVSSGAQRACALRLPPPPSPGSAGACIEVSACWCLPHASQQRA